MITVPRSDRPARARRVARLLHALGEPRAEAERHGLRLSSRVPDGPRGERLAIMDHRDRASGGGDREREAWVLRIVFAWSDRDAARAMDCSRSALERHLAGIAGRFDDDDVRALRHAMASVDAEGAPGFAKRVAARLPGRPWRWLIVLAVVVLSLDLLIRAIDSSRY